MTTLLRIDASSRQDGSWSRRLGDETVARLNPDHVVRRDLATDVIPHVTANAIEAFFSNPADWTEDQAAAQNLSAVLIDELLTADMILITVPMYNFGIPSALKAWIDQIVRIGRTFSFDRQSFKGLVDGKRAYVVIAYGADGYTNGDFQSADFVAPYLRFILGFIGITDVTIIPAEGINVGKTEEAEAHAGALIQSINPLKNVA